MANVKRVIYNVVYGSYVYKDYINKRYFNSWEEANDWMHKHHLNQKMYVIETVNIVGKRKRKRNDRKRALYFKESK